MTATVHEPAIVENAPTRALLTDRRSLDTTTPGYDRFRSWFTRALLSRPAILDAAQTRRLADGLPLLLATLHALPERLFGGDQVAFADALGWAGARDALAALSGPTVPLGRADLVNSPAGFKVVEFNTSSSLGSFEFGELCRASLTDPGFAEFADQAGLYYLDPMTRLVDTILADTALTRDSRPTVALVDWVSVPFEVDGSLFEDLMAEQGIRVLSGTVADLELTGAGLHLRGERVDVAYRTFLLSTVAEDPDAAARLTPLTEAARTGAATVFTPLNADLFGTKECLALLTDPANRDRFTDQEWDNAQRLLPWTRTMRGADTVAAQRGSLLDQVLREQGELVLKPTRGRAGHGVVGGWLVPAEQWAALARRATDGDYIVQRREHSVAERFAGPSDVDPSTCLLHWGMFVTAAGLSGGFVKGLPDRPQDIRFLGDGSHVGCVFHARA
ncbi:hypothetical protein [Actinophytocola sediminis]